MSGATAGVSVVQLYAGAFFPGLMLAGLYILYVILLAKLKPNLMPPLSAEQRFVPLPPVLDQVAHNGLASGAARFATRWFGRVWSGGLSAQTTAGGTSAAAVFRTGCRLVLASAHAASGTCGGTNPG